MTIAPADVRAAKATLAAHRKANRQARPKSPKADRGRVRDPGFLAFVRRQPCAVRQAQGLGCEGPIQACHIRTSLPGEPPTGLQRKPNDDRCTSMCAKHHAEQHSMGEMRFWARHSRDPFEIARQFYAEYSGQVVERNRGGS